MEIDDDVLSDNEATMLVELDEQMATWSKDYPPRGREGTRRHRAQVC